MFRKIYFLIILIITLGIVRVEAAGLPRYQLDCSRAYTPSSITKGYKRLMAREAAAQLLNQATDRLKVNFLYYSVGSPSPEIARGAPWPPLPLYFLILYHFREPV